MPFGFNDEDDDGFWYDDVDEKDIDAETELKTVEEYVSEYDY